MIGLPYPTAKRIVQTLVVEGPIACEPSRKYYRAAALAQSLSSGFEHEGKLQSERCTVNCKSIVVFDIAWIIDQQPLHVHGILGQHW